MKVYIASDHAGFELKEKIIEHFSKNSDFDSQFLKYELIDLGPHNDDRVDYPDFAAKLSQKITSTDKGILVCGSGQGVCMTANKFAHIRAALCTSEELAKLSRAHNDANVLCIGSRTVEENLNLKIVNKFMTTDFEGGRHQARVDKMTTACTQK